MKKFVKILIVIPIAVFSLSPFPTSAEDAKPTEKMIEQQGALSAYDDLYQMIMLNGYPYNYSGEYIDGSRLIILINNDDQAPYSSLLNQYNCIEFKLTERSYKELQALLDNATNMLTNNEKGSNLFESSSINVIKNSVDVEINAIEYIKLSKKERDELFIDGVNYKFVNTSNALNSLIVQEKNGARGWSEFDGKSYYIKGNGAFVTKSCVIDGIRYKFSSNGVCQGKYTGWTKSANGRRYWKNGVLLTNRWIKTKSGKYYYAGSNGYMVKGWAAVTRIDGKYSYFDSNGVWDGNIYWDMPV